MIIKIDRRFGAWDDATLGRVCRASVGVGAVLEWGRGQEENPSSWYYRAVGRDESQLATIEVAGGRLQSLDLKIGSATPGVADTVRSMSRQRIEYHPLIFLEPFETKIAVLIHNGVDVKVDVQYFKEESELIVGFDFERTRLAYMSPGGISYFVDENDFVTGVGVIY